MVRSFANTNTQTERIWNGLRSKHVPPDIQSRALAKLRMLNRAKTLDDLRNPPGNKLHALKDDRAARNGWRTWPTDFDRRGGGALTVAPKPLDRRFPAHRAVSSVGRASRLHGDAAGARCLVPAFDGLD